MGTNFYFADHPAEDWHMDAEFHIGKRSAAGFYCWDCGETLCKGGVKFVHSGVIGWHDNCPKCGNTREQETLDNSSAGRELGFNTGKPKKKKGVRSCSSFTWVVHRKQVEDSWKRRGIVDEYGKKYTIKEFRSVLEECPIQIFDMIGQEFS
jgi:hypothetical protein